MIRGTWTVSLGEYVGLGTSSLCWESATCDVVDDLFNCLAGATSMTSSITPVLGVPSASCLLSTPGFCKSTHMSAAAAFAEKHLLIGEFDAKRFPVGSTRATGARFRYSLIDLHQAWSVRGDRCVYLVPTSGFLAGRVVMPTSVMSCHAPQKDQRTTGLNAHPRQHQTLRQQADRLEGKPVITPLQVYILFRGQKCPP